MSNNNLIEFSNLSSSVKICSDCGSQRNKEEFCHLYKAVIRIFGKINENDNINGLLYTLDEVQELVAKQFQDLEDSDEPVKLIFEIELDSKLIESVFLNREFQFDTQDPKAIKESFYQLTNILLLLFEYGSDRQWQRPENTPVKRRSKIRSQINRYACMGNMIFTIDPQKQRAIVQCSHQLAHEHPQYRQTEFPAVAKEWIRDNVKYNLQSSESYRRLQQYGLIDANIHTKEQVYYWMTVFNEAKEKLTYYNKIFNSALMLYEREKTNSQFVKNFDTLLKPFAKAIEEYEEQLNALTQQKTWRPKN
ncbi:13101_t:CDS:2, partial [Racocetra fulgida]